MYEVNGLPSTVTSTRRAASFAVTWTLGPRAAVIMSGTAIIRMKVNRIGCLPCSGLDDDCNREPGSVATTTCRADRSRIAFAASVAMTSPLPLAVRIALWTSSVGLAIFVARRLFTRRPDAIDVGSLSQDWLAQQRWPP